MPSSDSMLYIESNGPEILATNFWNSEMEQKGYLYMSSNAGAVRLLVPRSMSKHIAEMRKGAKHVVASFLPLDKCIPGEHIAEWMIEDGSDEPWSCHLSMGQIDRVPSPESVGREWVGAVWGWKNGRAHKFFARPLYVQIVPSLPWLKRIEAAS